MDESGNHKQAEQRERIRWIVSILIPLLCALLSFCVIAKYTSSPTMKINAHAIQSLDDKKTTALELTAAATAASAGSGNSCFCRNYAYSGRCRYSDCG